MDKKDKLNILQGEREASIFALSELEKNTMVQKYLKLQEQKEKLDSLISDTELDIELDKVRNCHHCFVWVTDFPNTKRNDIAYCIRCGLHNQDIDQRYFDLLDKKTKELAKIFSSVNIYEYEITRDEYTIIGYEDLDIFIELFFKLKKDIPDEKNSYITDFISEYIRIKALYNINLPLEIFDEYVKNEYGYGATVHEFIEDNFKGYLEKYFKGKNRVLMKKHYN